MYNYSMVSVAGRAAGQVTAGQVVPKLAVRAGRWPSYCGAGCGPGGAQYAGQDGLQAEL